MSVLVSTHSLEIIFRIYCLNARQTAYSILFTFSFSFGTRPGELNPDFIWSREVCEEQHCKWFILILEVWYLMVCSSGKFSFLLDRLEGERILFTDGYLFCNFYSDSVSSKVDFNSCVMRFLVDETSCVRNSCCLLLLRVLNNYPSFLTLAELIL